jgi:hypothetical protein
MDIQQQQQQQRDPQLFQSHDQQHLGVSNAISAIGKTHSQQSVGQTLQLVGFDQGTCPWLAATSAVDHSRLMRWGKQHQHERQQQTSRPATWR